LVVRAVGHEDSGDLRDGEEKVGGVMGVKVVRAEKAVKHL
jgi:hypothetical protein